jgi:hypothetical protein
MTTRPPSPRIVAVTVAWLDQSSPWRHYTTDAAGRGWVRYHELLADEVGLDDWFRTELDATARGHPDVAGALIVYRLAGALAELVVGTLVDQRRSVAIIPAGLSLRFGDAARLDGLSVSAPTVALLADDPDTTEPGADVVPSVDALVDGALDGLLAVYRPLCEAVRARAPFGRSGMWGTLADHLAEVAVRRARERRRDIDAAWSAAEVLVSGLAAQEPRLRASPRRQVVATPSGRGTFVAKGTCCLIYKAATAGPGAGEGPRGLIAAAACTSCPLRDPDDRAARFAADEGRLLGDTRP